MQLLAKLSKPICLAEPLKTDLGRADPLYVAQIVDSIITLFVGIDLLCMAQTNSFICLGPIDCPIVIMKS